MYILLVEDNEQLLVYLKEVLESQNIATDITKDGHQALQLASTNNYDAIVLDLILPKLGGIEVCQKLRAKSITTPIIMASAKNTLHDKVQGLDIGADDYITKPYNVTELMARIRAITRRKSPFKNPIYKIKDTVLDSNKKLVTVKNKNIPLTRTQYRILEYLMRNRGRALNRQDIIENVWGSKDKIASNTVEVHISQLRKKISPQKGKELIKTIRNNNAYMIE